MWISSLVVALAVILSTAQSANLTYDYVIAGAGTAGLLLAVVLSENPNVTVAVIEAGADGRADTNITDPQKRGSLTTATHAVLMLTSTQDPYKTPNMTGPSRLRRSLVYSTTGRVASKWCREGRYVGLASW